MEGFHDRISYACGVKPSLSSSGATRALGDVEFRDVGAVLYEALVR